MAFSGNAKYQAIAASLEGAAALDPANFLVGDAVLRRGPRVHPRNVQVRQPGNEAPLLASQSLRVCITRALVHQRAKTSRFFVMIAIHPMNRELLAISIASELCRPDARIGAKAEPGTVLQEGPVMGRKRT